MLNPEITFRDYKKVGTREMAKCPAHDDSTSSLSIGYGDDGRMLLNCFAGCDYKSILAAVNHTPSDLFPDKQVPAKRKVVATYTYRDERGKPQFETRRYDPKGFSQHGPNGRNMDGAQYVLYHLDKLQTERYAFFVEGEKDVDKLWSINVPATCNAMGAGKWKPEYADQLKATTIKKIVVIPDNDRPGKKHAEEVASNCYTAGFEVRIVELPGVPEKGDVSDWLNAGHTKADLMGLVKATPLYTPSAASTVTPELADPTTAEPVDAAQMLASLIVFLRRFVVVTDDQAVAVALWTAHTHVIDAFDYTPYLQVTSATKGAGKTRLLEVLEPLVPNPWFTQRTTAAALYRKIDAESPSLLLDESDAAFGGEKEYAETLRGILNSGFKRAGRVTVCVGQGTKMEAKDFSTFCPKAIAGIGKLPDTVADRSIAIALQKKHGAEPCQRWRERDGRSEAAPLHKQLAAWAASAARSVLRDARPALPGGLKDRQCDVWEPLFAIADLAGDEWPDRARRAAIDLCGAVQDQDINVELLHDIRIVFEESGGTFIASKQLAEKLAEMDDRPWAAWGKNARPITPAAIATRLALFRIFPVKDVTGKMRGYERDRFVDAWTRYLTPKPSSRLNPNDFAGKSPISGCPPSPTLDTLKTQETPIKPGLPDGWTLRSPETGAEGIGSTLFNHAHQAAEVAASPNGKVVRLHDYAV